MPDQIENKVAQSGLINFDLEEYYPQGERALIDIKDYLYEGIILKEKDFRSQVSSTDWSQYDGKYVALNCTADAIIPTWAYMLITVHLEPYAKKVVFGDLNTLETVLFQEALSKINLEDFKDERLIIKGCGNLPVPESAYVEITRLLKPVAKSIMFGEACSTVPLYKRKAK